MRTKDFEQAIEALGVHGVRKGGNNELENLEEK